MHISPCRLSLLPVRSCLCPPHGTGAGVRGPVLGPLYLPRCSPCPRGPMTVSPPGSLTGISPFVGENDKTTLMNIRNYNVAFEERMFQGLTREAKGFVIKVLVNDRL